MEEVKTGAAEEPKTPEKSTNDIIAEIRAENEKINKRLKDQEDFINRQAGEIGELRKGRPETKVETKDDLVESLVADLKADGLDEETARYNAKILAKSGVKVLDRKLNERMMHEVIDLVDEAMDDGKIDKTVFQENENEIMSEFRARKTAPTARQNYKIVKDCYEIVTKRKAEALRSKKEQEDNGKRDASIAAGSPPPPGSKGAVSDDEAKQVTAGIMNAGKPRSSVFF